MDEVGFCHKTGAKALPV